ncbi:MAG: SDR family oxidoreductase [Sandaracinaceae bacterium]|nr:SDR family oxidoreductase [Sandaracinaceae bacterium]
MSIFITGATGYLGSYVASILLDTHKDRLSLLVRGRDRAQAVDKLWRAFQLHMDAKKFYESLARIDFVLGDLTSEAPHLGIAPDQYKKLVRSTDSVIHIAASLNRKSEKACLNTNLRGTLGVIKLAQDANATGGIRRFSHVSTVAVAGQRDRETVQEDTAIDWNRSDYDPYGRTKKFCEHMVRELLPDVPKTFFRPSIVMGDSRRVETTQFDMVRAFCVLADLPAVPVRPDARLDIVHADFVASAIATLHQKKKTAHEIYHLSSGEGAKTAIEIATALAGATGKSPPRFLPGMEKPFSGLVNTMMNLPKANPLFVPASLLKVFLPYVTYDTVFDNTRVCKEMGKAPVPFTEYAAPLYRWAKGVNFEYPYQPLPAAPKGVSRGSKSLELR